MATADHPDARAVTETSEGEDRMTATRRRRHIAMLAGAAAAVAIAGGVAILNPRDPAPRAGASAATLAQGQAVYIDHCAACHGASLEGQPDWHMPLPSGRLPAPPHDASGHTWHHPDAILLRIIREGTGAVVGGGYESDMPGFADVLSEDEIRSVLAYIQSSWPERERSLQERATEAYEAGSGG
jgi:mono/diheme cytochrome c family protein